MYFVVRQNIRHQVYRLRVGLCQHNFVYVELGILILYTALSLCFFTNQPGSNPTRISADNTWRPPQCPVRD